MLLQEHLRSIVSYFNRNYIEGNNRNYDLKDLTSFIGSKMESLEVQDRKQLLQMALGEFREQLLLRRIGMMYDPCETDESIPYHSAYLTKTLLHDLDRWCN